MGPPVAGMSRSRSSRVCRRLTCSSTVAELHRHRPCTMRTAVMCGEGDQVRAVDAHETRCAPTLLEGGERDAHEVELSLVCSRA